MKQRPPKRLQLMASTRNIADAVSALQDAWHWLAEEWPKRFPNAPKLILVEVFRPGNVQRAYYAQGREKLAIVNKLRQGAGLYPISETENRRKITYAAPGQSRHERWPSQAFDIGFVQNKAMVWDEANYQAAATIVHEKYPDIIWGADWDNDGKTSDERFVDRPHFQIK